MRFDLKALDQIRRAVQLKSYIEEDHGLRDSAVTAAMGAATVLQDLADEVAGASWLGADSKCHALLVSGAHLVHVVMAGDVVLAATNYSAPIDTLRAEDCQQVGPLVEDGCRVMRWHVTLRDGSVISIRASNGQHADEIAEFVRAHLIPPGAP